MIYGIGRNYAKHAAELGNQPAAEAPIVFFKPPASIVGNNATITLPKISENVHYEGEIAFRFGKNLKPDAICIALDLTARDQQKIAQDKKLPWSLAKGFKQSTALGGWAPVGDEFKWDEIQLSLMLNGELKQSGFAKDMIFKVPQLVSYLVETFPIEPGDIVLTGTPEGVGQVRSGDLIHAEIKGLSQGQWNFK